jgi:hypothetical protein
LSITDFYRKRKQGLPFSQSEQEAEGNGKKLGMDFPKICNAMLSKLGQEQKRISALQSLHLGRFFDSMSAGSLQRTIKVLTQFFDVVQSGKLV